jgi:predicted O-methyltransferase YrrM
VGALLASLAAAAPTGARIAELGTGAGVGLAWIVYGLGARDDASVFTVDTNEELLMTVAAAGWPLYVQFVHDDGAHAVEEFAPFHLVFADAAGGKIEGLDATIDALAPGGVLIVDDMDLARHADDGLLEQLGAVRDHLVADPSLVAAELDFASGVIVATKRPV